jgi:hypothetical protein
LPCSGMRRSHHLGQTASIHRAARPTRGPNTGHRTDFQGHTSLPVVKLPCGPESLCDTVPQTVQRA